MTDFGRRMGNMLKSVYDPNEDGIIALAQTVADMRRSTYDTDLSGVVDAVPDHASSHEDTGSDEINATGLTGAGGGTHAESHENDGADEIDATGLDGAGGTAIEGDGVSGRKLRESQLVISNGTNANTIRCELFAKFNGDTIAEVNNLGKSGTVGDFSLDAAGEYITLAATGLSGDCIGFISSWIKVNGTNITITINGFVSGTGIKFAVLTADGGTRQDLTALLDLGTITIDLLYITDA